jgi:hypothetical protein
VFHECGASSSASRCCSQVAARAERRASPVPRPRSCPTTRAELSKVEPIVLVSKDGDRERDAWPLRALTKALVGDEAMPNEAIGEEPASLRIDAAKWNDATLEPVIRSNRRGRLKFVWLDTKTHDEDHDEPQQKGVRELRFP